MLPIALPVSHIATSAGRAIPYLALCGASTSNDTAAAPTDGTALGASWPSWPLALVRQTNYGFKQVQGSSKYRVQASYLVVAFQRLGSFFGEYANLVPAGGLSLIKRRVRSPNKLGQGAS